MLDFLKWPRVGGIPTFLMGLLHATLIGIALFVGTHVLRGMRADPRWRSPRQLLVGSDPMFVLINSGLWGFNAVMTVVSLVTPPMHRHYMICVTPLMMLWGAGIVFEFAVPYRRAVLGVMVGVQALVSIGLMTYIHQTQIIKGEYGTTWRAQQPGFVKPGG